MRSTFGLCLIAGLSIVVAAAGCGSQGSDDGTAREAPGSPSAHSDEHDHDHDHGGHDHSEEHEGPHGGHVIELGRNHEYHAEVVEHSEAENVTVYLLDQDLQQLAIAQPSITMNLTVDNQPRTYELSAQNGDGGKSSRFQASGSELFEALHEHEASGKLMVTIDGTPYSGDVEHHHHAGHDHEHGGEGDHAH